MRHDTALCLYILSVYVRLSVTRRYCIETPGRIEFIFGLEASFQLFYTVF